MFGISIVLLAAFLLYRSLSSRLPKREPLMRRAEERYYGDYNDYYEH